MQSFFLRVCASCNICLCVTQQNTMNDEPADRVERSDDRESQTRIRFDLEDVLAPGEVEQFRRAADEAGAKNLTEHFLNLTLRTDPNKAA